jgi:HAMP domain-containing protein
VRRPGLSLQSRFYAAILALLAIVVLVMVLLWQRQQSSQHEVSEVTRNAMHGLLSEQVRIDGEAEVRQLADALANPLYYFDLDAVGALARAALREADVDYVLVYDAQGRILHDGSGDIAAYGQPMNDPLAKEVIAATGPHALTRGQLLDVSRPVMIGDERLGGVRIGYSLVGMARDEAEAMDALRGRIDDVGRRSLLWLLLLSAALAVIAIVAAVVVQRLLVQPIQVLGDAARQIESGNFTSPVPVSKRQDELGDLIRAFGRMRESVARHDRDIRRMAYTDALTGLSNRLAFRESAGPAPAMLRGAGASWRCCSPTSTTSSGSTTPWATRPATRCCCSSPPASDRAVRRWAARRCDGGALRWRRIRGPAAGRRQRARRRAEDGDAAGRSAGPRTRPADAAARAPGVPGHVDRHHPVPGRCRSASR